MGYVILLWHSLSLPYNYLNALRQMQTVWDSNLLAMFMFGLFLKNYKFVAKALFTKMANGSIQGRR